MKVIQLPMHYDKWNAEDIKKIVKQLPVSFEEVFFHIKGSLIIAERMAKNKDLPAEKQLLLVDKDGRPLQDNLVYKVAKAQGMNQNRRIRRAYKRGGHKAVIEYLEWFEEHHRNIIKRFPDFFNISTEQELIKRNT